MTKKITISVPDELHEKMEKWKSAFNFSSVFREAISEKIRTKEDFQKRLKEETKNMNEIIERLKKEKQEGEQNWHTTGTTDGLDWAESALYDDLQAVISLAEDITATRIAAFVVTHMSQGGRTVDLEDWLDEKEEEYRDSGFLLHEGPIFDKWSEGFIEGVREFWNEIKDKL